MSCARAETQATVHSTATHQDGLKENCRRMERSVRVFFRAVIWVNARLAEKMGPGATLMPSAALAVSGVRA